VIYGQLREELDKQVSGAVAAAMVAAKRAKVPARFSNSTRRVRFVPS
jgi:hypothetical protein